MVAKVNDVGGLARTGFVLREMARLYVRAQREQVGCCSGTTAAQCHILTELGRARAALPITVLARHIGVDKGWISRAVGELVSDGLLLRIHTVNDRRHVLIRLSSKGRKRVAALNRVLDLHAARVLARVPLRERGRVHVAFEIVVDALREGEVERQTSGARSACATRSRRLRPRARTSRAA